MRLLSELSRIKKWDIPERIIDLGLLDLIKTQILKGKNLKEIRNF